MRFSMLYSGEQILSFKSCLVFYAGDSISIFFYHLNDKESNGKNYLFAKFVAVLRVYPSLVLTIFLVFLSHMSVWGLDGVGEGRSGFV